MGAGQRNLRGDDPRRPDRRRSTTLGRRPSPRTACRCARLTSSPSWGPSSRSTWSAIACAHRRPRSAGAVPKGEARVLPDGIGKKGVYRDEDGVVRGLVALHAPRLPGALQRRGTLVGLPLPRLALRRRRLRAGGPRSAAARAPGRGPVSVPLPDLEECGTTRWTCAASTCTSPWLGPRGDPPVGTSTAGRSTGTSGATCSGRWGGGLPGRRTGLPWLQLVSTRPTRTSARRRSWTAWSPCARRSATVASRWSVTTGAAGSAG